MKRIYVKILFFTLFIALMSNALSPVSGALDTTKIGVEVGDKKTWTINKLTATGWFEEFLDDEDVKKGDTLSMEIVDVDLDFDNAIGVKYTEPNGSVEVDRVGMDYLGSNLIFTDWEYWKTEAETDGYDVTDGSSTFKISQSESETYAEGDDEYDLDDYKAEEYSETTEYDKATGFMNSESFLWKITHVNGTTSVFDVAIGGPSDDSGIPGFEFTTILAAFALILTPIILKRRK